MVRESTREAMDGGAPSKHEAQKRRKAVQKTVVSVKTESDVGKHNGKSEGPPSDLWSWRKYGQKPIKGSPYPRGYYRCSTSKGCSAKKQVERCRTDASVLIITYTSDHNHSGPRLTSMASARPTPQSAGSTKQANASSSEQALGSEVPPPKSITMPRGEELKDKYSEDDAMNDFFDGLEELPMSSSSFTSLVRGSIFDERILLLP